MTLAFAFWAWWSILVFAVALWLTLGTIFALFGGRAFLRRNLPGLVALMALTPFVYMAGLFLWNVASTYR